MYAFIGLSLIDLRGGTGPSYLCLSLCKHCCVHAGAYKGTTWSVSVYAACEVSAVRCVPVCLQHIVCCYWPDLPEEHQTQPLYWDRRNLVVFVRKGSLLWLLDSTPLMVPITVHVIPTS